MKKIYEVPAMEIVRLDASENIAKLPDVDAGTPSTTETSDGTRVVNTVRTTTLASFLDNLTGGTGSNLEA